jgi:hypothetical protein
MPESGESGEFGGVCEMQHASFSFVGGVETGSTISGSFETIKGADDTK